MSFDKLLPHTCDIQLSGQEKIGVDDWGRDIYKDKKPFNTPCRFVSKSVIKKTNNGLAEVLETSILLGKNCAVDNEMKVTNIKDNDGNLLAAKPLEVQEILTRTARKKRHHYKVLLQGVD